MVITSDFLEMINNKKLEDPLVFKLGRIFCL